ncbi:MAG: hypothetical protein SGPRY_009654, partial [Prymnesium sp.]
PHRASSSAVLAHHSAQHKRKAPHELLVPVLPEPQAVRLLLSATVAASMPPWYTHDAVDNWLRFTSTSSQVVLHVDAACAVDLSMSQARDVQRDGPSLPKEWLWLWKGDARARVHVNPTRLHTARRTGSLLVAHLHNFMYGMRQLQPDDTPGPLSTEKEGRRLGFTHFVFLAVNCFFIRSGVEVYVAQRQASLAVFTCSQGSLRPNKHHCTRERWFAALNGNRSVQTRSLVEGHFFPVPFLEEVVRTLRAMDVQGRPLRAHSNRSSYGFLSPAPDGRESLFDRLPVIPCTAEENVLPALAAQSSLLRGILSNRRSTPTEQLAWIPPVLTPNATVDLATVRKLVAEDHSPQQLCRASSACTTCPDRISTPQTKFLVKRVGADVGDASKVRRLIASLPGHREGINVDGCQSAQPV